MEQNENTSPNGSEPAYFRSLTLENVRCFGPAQKLSLVDMYDQPVMWTVILGNNGVGKTTLLQSLIGMVPTIPFKIHNGGNFRGFAYLPSLFREKTSEPELGRNAIANLKRESQLLELTAEIGPMKMTAKGDFSFHFNSTKKLLVEPLCVAYGASRRMGTAALSDKPTDPTESLFKDDAPLINAEEWLLQADYAAKEPHFARRRDKIVDILINILPEVEEIRFEKPTDENPKWQVKVKTPYGWVKLSQLSLGYKTLIAWMVDFASRLFDRYPNSPNPLAEPAIVLVDEIDLHLHPTWQRKLLKYLSDRFPKTQFIVTAHSPLVVQAAPDANIVLLKREGDHVIIENDVKAIKNWRVDQILTSELFGLDSARPPETANLMEERKHILAKGSLDDTDKARLKELEIKIGPLPVAESPSDIEAMDIIRRAAARLQTSSNP